MTCANCGGTTFEPGFLEDRGEGSSGYIRWIGAPLQVGVFGRAKRAGKQRWAVAAHRCTTCARLEFYAADPV